MRHTCADGHQTKLQRHGPIGTIEGVSFTCPRCGYAKTAQRMEDDTKRMAPRIVAALSK